MQLSMIERPVPEGQLVVFLDTNEPIPVRRLFDLVSEIDKFSRRRLGRDAFVELVELSTGSVLARIAVWSSIVAGAAGIGSFCIDVAEAMRAGDNKISTCTARLTEGHGVVSIRLRSGDCDVTVSQQEIPHPTPEPVPIREAPEKRVTTAARSQDGPNEQQPVRYREVLAEPTPTRLTPERSRVPVPRVRDVRTVGRFYKRGDDAADFVDAQGSKCEVDVKSSNLALPPWKQETMADDVLVIGTLAEFAGRKVLTVERCEPLDAL